MGIKPYAFNRMGWPTAGIIGQLLTIMHYAQD